MGPMIDGLSIDTLRFLRRIGRGGRNLATMERPKGCVVATSIGGGGKESGNKRRPGRGGGGGGWRDLNHQQWRQQYRTVRYSMAD